MSNSNFLRISLELHYFFNDYRQKSRILINDDTKNIFELQNLIKETFNIKKSFYLQCDNHFLPPSQDINVLNYDDTICVIPLIEDDLELKSNKNVVEIPVEPLEIKERKKEKKKRKRKISTSEDEVSKCDNESNKRKTKKSIRVLSDEIVTSLNENEVPVSNEDQEKRKTLRLKDKIDFDALRVSKGLRDSNDSLRSPKGRKESHGEVNGAAEVVNADFIEVKSRKSKKKSLEKKNGLEETQDLDLSKTKMGSWDNTTFLSSSKTKNSTALENLSRTEIEKTKIGDWDSSTCALSNSEKTSTPNMSKTTIGTWGEISTIPASNIKNVSTSQTSNKNGASVSQMLTFDNGDKTKIGSWDDTAKNGTVIRNESQNLSKTKISAWDNTSFLLQSSKDSTLQLMSQTKMGSWDSFATPKSNFSDKKTSNASKRCDSSKNESFISAVSGDNESTLKNITNGSNTSKNVTVRSSKSDKPNLNEKETPNDTDTTNSNPKLNGAIPNEQKDSINSSQNELSLPLSDSVIDDSLLDNSGIIPSSQRKTNKLMKQLNSVSSALKRLSDGNDLNSVSTLKRLSDGNGDGLEDKVTKRRRTRTRKRNRKSIDTELELKTPVKVDYVPPKTVAAPKIHKRFDEGDDLDNSGLIERDFDLSNNDSVLSHSTPYYPTTKRVVEMSTIAEEFSPEGLSVKYEGIGNVLKDPPNVGSKIIFKTLKLNEEYTPVVSGLVIAEVLMVANEKDYSDLELKVIAGHEELKDPIGRFSMMEDEVVNETETDSSITYLRWNDIIQPKLFED